MAKMTDIQLRTVLENEIQQSVLWSSENIREDQIKNLQYYLGLPMGNEVAGRSQVVSWDVFEVIESAMPGFLEPFFATDRIGEFKPRTQADEAFCDQSSDVVNSIIKDQNNGFLLFNTWFKDALLSKIGIVRAEWEEGEECKSGFRGLTDEQLAQLAQDESVTITAHTANPMPGIDPAMLQPGQPLPMLHDVDFVQRKPGKVEIENVRPENFVVSRNVSRLADSRTVGEWVTLTRSELKEKGFRQAYTIQSYESGLSQFDEMQSLRDGDGTNDLHLGTSDDESLEEVRLFKGFMRADYDGDGIAEWRRVLVGSGDDPFLENEEAEYHNYAILTPIPIPHRVIGMAYADAARTIQDLKTSLTRQYLDSLYLANRPRTYVNTSAGVSLDDLLSDRIGGLIRGTGPAETAIRPIQTTMVAKDALEGLQLADTMRETRLGIAKFNPGLEADALHQTATGVRSVNNQVDKRQKMTLRVMAETGIKDLFRLVLRLITKYQDIPSTIRLRGEWVTFDPRSWNPDMDCIVSVGVGTSDETETLMMLTQFGQYMQWAQANGIVGPPQVYEYGKMLAKNARLQGADTKLLADPSKQEQKPPPPGPFEIEQMKAQLSAQTESQKQQGEIQLERERMQMQAEVDRHRQQVEAEQQSMRLQQERELAQFKAQLQQQADQFKAKLQAETAIQVARINAEGRLMGAQVAAQTVATPEQDAAADAALDQ